MMRRFKLVKFVFIYISTDMHSSRHSKYMHDNQINVYGNRTGKLVKEENMEKDGRND